MSEYIKLLAKNGIRFTGAPVTISPQLEDYDIQSILHPVSSERDVKFRIVLYVPTLEQNELRILFPNDHVMEVHLEHGTRKMTKRQDISWSRDCRYMFRLPEDVSKNSLTAIWTFDSFLIIQARGSRPMALSGEEEDAKQLIPSRVCGILRPHLDVGIVKDMLWLHQTEVEEICKYVESKGMVPKDCDVFELLKKLPREIQSSDLQESERSEHLDPQQCSDKTAEPQVCEESVQQQSTNIEETKSPEKTAETNIPEETMEHQESKDSSELVENKNLEHLKSQSVEETKDAKESKNLEEPMESESSESPMETEESKVHDQKVISESEVKSEEKSDIPKTSEDKVSDLETTPTLPDSK